MCTLGRLEHLEQEERAPDSLPPTLDAAARKRERAELHAHLADGVIVADATGRIVFANEATCRLLGMNPVGETIERYLGAGHRATRDGLAFPAAAHSVPRAALGGETGRGNERRVRRADGTEVIVRSDVTPLVAADGSRFGVALTMRDRTERQQAGAERARLAAIVESCDEAIIGNTLDGIITSWNPAATRLYGYSVEEVIGQSVSLLVPADHRDELAELLARVARGERIPHFEMERLRKDGTRIIVSVSIAPVRAASGAVVAASVVARDITERKQAEEALRASEARLRAVIDNVPISLYVTDAAGVIVLCEGRALRQIGFDGRSVLGRRIQDYYSTRPELVDAVERALSGEDSGFTSRVHDAVFENHVVPLRDAHGQVTGIIGIGVNITERERVEAALREREAHLAAVLDATPDAMVIVDGDGHIVHVNAQTERLFGYAREELLGQSVELLLPERFRLGHVRHRAAYAAAPRARPMGAHLNLYARRKDGGEVPVEISLSPLETAEGTLVITAIRDVTERKQVEAERMQHQHEREMTTRVLAAQETERKRIARELHDETAQALSTLLINLDLLEPYIPEEGTVLQSGFRRVRALARRALEETRALAHGLRPAILDDVGLVGALPGLSQQCTETYGVPVQVDVDTPRMGRLPPEVEVALFRIAQEALTNIGKHAAARSARVTLSFQEGTARLIVQDDGKGFDLAQVRRPTRQGGLGLYGLHERVALLGGTLALDTAPGQGVRLTVTVPVPGKAESLRSPGQPSKRRGTRTHVGIKVLLVDDHAVVREGLRMALDAQPGMTVVGEAEDGRQALGLIEELRPDVVVMDIAMPNMNGLEATRQSKRRFPDVKVVILTMYEDEEYVAQIVEAGANGCVVKRSAGTELLLALHAAMRGERYFSPSIARVLVEGYGKQLAPTDRIGRLTEREREVLQLVAEGKTNKDIADLLVLSIKTVKVHRAHIMEKLGVHDRMDLVKRAQRMGLVMAE